MKLLHRIKVGRSQLLILKKVLRSDFLGCMAGVTIDVPFDIDIFLNSAEGTREEHINELEELGVDCAIPVKMEDKIVAYYVHFKGEPNKFSPAYKNWEDLKAIMEHELKELLACNYLVVLRQFNKKDLETPAASIAEVQSILNNKKLPFEFTPDEELCMLRKNSKQHTKLHVYAKCKYYKNKESKYVVMQKFPNKTKEKTH